MRKNRLTLWPFLLLIIGFCTPAKAEKCSRPSVERKQISISKIIEEININVYRCHYKDPRNSYSDITDNCLEAFETGIMIDKWNRVFNSNSYHWDFQEETATVDLSKNQIRLRCGTVCRYDRGFCYGSEHRDFGVVWKVHPKQQKDCRDLNSRLVFDGFVDVWIFKPQNLKYVVFKDPNTDKSFALRLAHHVTCFGTTYWLAEDRDYMISFHNSSGKIHPTKRIPHSRNIIPLQYVARVAEAVLQDCDSRSSPIDDQLTLDAVSDPENLRNILVSLRNSVNITNTKIGNSQTSVSVENDMKINSKMNWIESQFANISIQLKSFAKQSEFDTTKVDLLKKVEDMVKEITEVKDFVKYNSNFESAIENMKKNIQRLEEEVASKNINGNIHKDEEAILQQLQSMTVAIENYRNDCYEQIHTINNTYTETLNSLKTNLHDFEARIDDNTTNKIIEKEIHNKFNEGAVLIEREFRNEFQSLAAQISDKMMHFQTQLDSLKGNFTASQNDLERELRHSIEFNHKTSMESIDDLAQKMNEIEVRINDTKVLNEGASKIKDGIIKKIDEKLNSLGSKCDTCTNGIGFLKSFSENTTNQFKEHEQKEKQFLIRNFDTIKNEMKGYEDQIDSLRNDLTQCQKEADKNTSVTDEEIKKLKKVISDLETKMNTPHMEIEKNFNRLEKKFEERLKKLEEENEVLKKEIFFGLGPNPESQ